MNNKKILTYIFTLIILSTTVLAEFLVSSDKASMSVCPRDTQLFIDKVSNYVSDAEFSVNSVGSAYAWSTTIPISFFLNKNSEELIYTYVTPPSTISPGNYNINIIATSNGVSKTIAHDIIVKDCHTISTSLAQQKSLCPNELGKYEILIKNTGNYQESYNISVQSIVPSWIKLSENFITLPNGSSKLIYAYVQPPSGTKEGTYEFSIISKSLTSNALISSPSTLYVKPCYDYNSNLNNEPLNFCEHTVQTIPVIIENKGTSSNKYSIKIDGPAWANLDKNNLELKSGVSTKFNVILSPDYGVSGDFDINVKVIPENGLTAAFIIKAYVRKCNSAAIDILTDKDTICNTLENSYDVVVNNNGEVTKTYKLELNAPSWLSINQEQFTLNVNESRYFKLNAKPWLEVENKDYNVKVKAVAQDDSKIIAEDSMTIATVSKTNCYMLEIIPQKTDLVMYFDSSATVPINIKNRGYQTANYELSLSDTASSFTQLNPSNIQLHAGSSQVVYLYVAPSENVQKGTYKAIISAKLPDSPILQSKTVNIRITDATELSLWERIKIYIANLFTYKQPVVETTNLTASNVTTATPVSYNNYAWLRGYFFLYKYYIIAGLIILSIIIILIILLRKKFRRKR